MAIVMECSEAECRLLKERGGRLYEGLEDVLAELKEGYRLFIVSNCQEDYLEAFLSYHRLRIYFEDFEVLREDGKPKGEI